MNFSKKGGSSMDFMFTYGWAVFVVLLVILYLYLFGFLNPYNFIPEYCIMPSGFHCEDAVLNTFNSGSISGVGLVGMKVRNGRFRTISHMYIVMDPEDEYCPGYFGVVVTPPLKPMKSGEARNLRFYYLNWLCASSDDCIDETYDYCFESFNFCVDKGTDPDCPPGGSGSCGETQMDCKCTEEDYVCMEEEGIPRCIKSPPSVYVDRLVCSCYDTFCISEPKKIYNCCDSDFTKGYHENVPDIAEIELNAYNPQGFCPEYNVSENDICQYYIDLTSSGKHNIKDMSDVKYYGTEFKVIYKFSGSTIFHSQVGKLGVTNSGSI